MMKKLNSVTIAILIVAIIITNCTAQQKMVYGKVYAFKDLALNHIQVNAIKAKTTTITDSLGRFNISCEPDDKLDFSGSGFYTVSLKLKNEKQPVKVKMLLKRGPKNEIKALENKHVQKEELDKSIENYSHQNYDFKAYPDVFTLLSSIFRPNEGKGVGVGCFNDSRDPDRPKEVRILRENMTWSQVPALLIVNGNRELDITNVLPGDIETVEILEDGTVTYGVAGSNGVVIITTSKN